VFTSHAVGTKTLFAKGNLRIDLEQAAWKKTGGGTINRQVKYSTNGGKSWRAAGQTGPKMDGYMVQFTEPNVQLSIHSSDYTGYAWSDVKYVYNVYILTEDITDVTGQCVQGKSPGRRARLRGRRLESSDGVTFPSGDDVKVSKAMAEEACAGLGKLSDSCVTDLRLVNEFDAVEKIAGDYVTVAAASPSSAISVPTTTAVVSGSDFTMTHLCLSVVTLVTLLVV